MPRKRRTREKNGRPQREATWERLEPVLRRRCRECGLPPTYENMRRVRGQEGGTYWGKLWISGRIKRKNYEGFEAFSKLRTAFLQSIDAPRDTPKIASLEPGGLGVRPENVAIVEAIRARFTAIDRDLRKYPLPIVRAAYATIEERNAPELEVRLAGRVLYGLLVQGEKSS